MPAQPFGNRPLEETCDGVRDGITDNVHIDEIVELVRKGPLDAAAKAVAAKAIERMAAERRGQPSKPDDLSLILFRKLYRPRGKQNPESDKKQ